MKLSEFKKGDLIHRTGRAKRPANKGDYYLNDMRFTTDHIEFLGFESGIVFYRWGNRTEVDNFLAEDYNDDKWDYYPIDLHEKLIKEVEKEAPDPKEQEILNNQDKGIYGESTIIG